MTDKYTLFICHNLLVYYLPVAWERCCLWKCMPVLCCLVKISLLLNLFVFWSNFVSLKQNEAQSARAESKHKGVNQCLKPREDVPLVEFMYLVFTRMPGESYRRRLRSLLLCLCYVFWALVNSLVCWFKLRKVFASMSATTRCQQTGKDRQKDV